VWLCTVSGESQNLGHPHVAVIRARLSDVLHDIAAIVLWTPGDRGLVIAIVNASTGDPMAWQQVAVGLEPPVEPEPLADLDWDGRPEPPSRLLLARQSPWLSAIAHWFLPDYSIARRAASLVNAHRDEGWAVDGARELRSAVLVGYLPVADRDVFERHLTDWV
jgi:hypothetical protein